jgi:hypothetical protein
MRVPSTDDVLDRLMAAILVALLMRNPRDKRKSVRAGITHQLMQRSCDRFLTFGRRRNPKAKLTYRRFNPNRIFTAGCNAMPGKMPGCGK